MQINDRSFSVHSLTKGTHSAWYAFIVKLAKVDDRPVARFISQHLKGIPKENHRDVLAAWMATPGWDSPSESAISEAANSLQGIRALATYCLMPELSWEEACLLIKEDNAEDVQEAIQSGLNPTDEDIVKANQALRDRINARNEEAGNKEAG